MSLHPAAAPAPSLRRHWAWGLVALVLIVLFVGAIIIDVTTPSTDASDMTCVELNDRADEIRDDNSQGPYVQPYAEWDQDDLDEFRGILDEITERQNTDGDSSCHMR